MPLPKQKISKRRRDFRRSHHALEMPQPERRRRIEAIRAHVRAHDLEAWIAAQLADLDRVRSRPRRALARLRRAESHAP